MREQLTQWLMGADTCFLLGAGCSRCAGKPLINELTTRVLNGAEDGLKQQFDGLRTIGNRPTTIEDLMNYLIRYRDVLGAIKDRSGHIISVEEIDRWLKEIKHRIVVQVADQWIPSSFHQQFLQRICDQRHRRVLDLFSLNYDTVLESSLDELRLPYVDGFRGANRAWFDAKTFDEAGNSASCRIFKLHGSVNWARDAHGHVRRGRSLETEPNVIYPSEQKYIQTQFGVYEELMERFRTRLRIDSVNNCLVVLGYSFHDEHINEAIRDAINTRTSNLTVVAFIGPEKNRSQQDERLVKFAEHCDSRFNAFLGDGESGKFIGNAVDRELAQAILSAKFWRFEKLVKFIAGEVQ